MIKISTKKGFTLTEMLVVMGIVTILMAVLVFNYQDVNNKSILKNVAYDVALSIREVQSLGLGAKKYVEFDGGDNSFNTPFGAQFNYGADSYMMFADENSDDFCGELSPINLPCDCDSGFECLSEISPSAGGIIFYDACVIDETNSICVNDNNGSYASVIFKRPNPDAKIIYNIMGTPQYSGDVINIIFKSRNSNDGQAVSITKTGQVSVITCDLTDWDGVANDKKCGL